MKAKLSNWSASIERDVRAAKLAMKRGSDALLALGAALVKLRSHTDRPQFVRIVEDELDLSEVSAMRYIRAFEKFGHSRSQVVGGSRPTVLMILAASSDERVDQLVRGDVVTVNGKPKTLPELSVKDAKRLKVCPKRKRKSPIAPDAHRDLAQVTQRLRVWAFDAETAITKFTIQEKKLTRIGVKAAIECLQKIERQLR